MVMARPGVGHIGKAGEVMKNYLYVSTSLDGWTNLGTDEWFLEHIGPDDMALYFYINENAVIIGRNQNPWAECDLNAMERDHVQLVRRVTGGGAVYHDRGNLNFSFIAGVNRYDQDRQFRLILNAVRALGIPCEFTGRNDLAAAGRKFSGNAFCKRSKVQQHHGTLLIASDLDQLQKYLRVDPRKLRSKGTKSVRSRVCNLSDFLPGLRVDVLLEALKDAFAREYGAYEALQTEALPWADIRPYIEKHASWDWRLGETPVRSRMESASPGATRKCSSPCATRGWRMCGLHRRAGWSLPDIRAACSAAASAPPLRRRWPFDKPQIREVGAFVRAGL